MVASFLKESLMALLLAKRDDVYLLYYAKSMPFIPGGGGKVLEGVTFCPVTRCRVRPWRKVRLLGASREEGLFKFDTACLFFPHAG